MSNERARSLFPEMDIKSQAGGSQDCPQGRETSGNVLKTDVNRVRFMIMKSFYGDSPGVRFTADEWANANGVPAAVVRRRFDEFRKAGLIYRNGFGTGYGETIESFKMFPYLRNRMQLLVIRHGIDAAAREFVRRFFDITAEG